MPTAPWPGRPVLTHTPAPPRPSRRPARRAGLRPRHAVLAALAGAAVFAALYHGVGTRTWHRADVNIKSLALAAGLSVDEVTVAGNVQTPAKAIFDALDLPNIETQLELDTSAVRHRIERLPWIASATVTRVLPNGLAIEVQERTPAVVWQDAGREWLVDRSARILGPNPAGDRATLPRVSGLGGAEAAAPLLDALAAAPAVAARLELAERVSGRRWTLHLSGGTKLLLPAEGLARALALATEGQPGRRLVDRAATTVDLRSPTRIFIGAGG
ncbi:MAG: cell division protein FtsQ/DivIB [Hyphomicrobiaceae bacterium]